MAACAATLDAVDPPAASRNPSPSVPPTHPSQTGAPAETADASESAAPTPSVTADPLLAVRLIAAGRFAEAKLIVARVLPQGRHQARAHYLMGRVLEHEQDWQGAARQYRAAREARP